MNRLFEYSLNHSNILPNQAKLKDLEHLIREGEEDASVKEKFDLAKCGNPDEQLKIKGSKSLLSGFETIDCKKIDISEKLKNIQLADFNENDIVLNFLPTKENGDLYNLQAIGIYDFSKEFLEYHFSLWNFAKYCFENNYQDILWSNIVELLKRKKNNRRQYRLIEKENKYFIRGMTSNRYKKYDNHLALYLALFSLHHFAKLERVNFQVEKAFMTDSDIYLFVEQDNPILIKDFGNLYFGVLIKNNELADGALSIDFRYRIINNDRRFFGGIIENEVISINHTLGINKVGDRLEKLYNFKEVRTGLLNLIFAIKNPHLSENQLYKIFDQIIKSRTSVRPETKEAARQLKESIENTYTIIEVFDRLKEISSDIEEQLYLEKIFHEALYRHSASVSKENN